LLSRRVSNDEAALLELIAAVTTLADGGEVKRVEGKTHTQAVLALARRRLNVLWALLRYHAIDVT
jgi:hypothetical protein